MRNKFSILYEEYIMKNYNLLQMSVLPIVGKAMGVTNIDTQLTPFLNSEKGMATMKLYKSTLFDMFGYADDKHPNTDIADHPGFDSTNKEEHQKLVNIVATEIVSKLKELHA
jgi:hypothetical protein